MSAARNILVLALAGVGGACGPDDLGDVAGRYADAVCRGISTCGCANPFSDDNACAQEFSDRFGSLVDEGLTLDRECYRKVIDRAKLDDCSAVDAAPEETRCTVLRGSKKQGDPCIELWAELPPFNAEECGAGLICYDGRCAPKGSTGPYLAEGDACVSEQAASCHVSHLYCHESGVCRARPRLGEGCDSPFACALDDGAGSLLYCRGWSPASNGTCTTQAAMGEPCEPTDWFACTDGTARGWCEPTQRVCVEDGPAVCLATEFPGSGINPL